MKRVLLTASFFALATIGLWAIPQSVQDTQRTARQQGFVVGAGMSSARVQTAARNAATMSARAEITRELDSIVGNIQDMHEVYHEINDCFFTEMFFESVIDIVARSRLQGSHIIYEHREPNGNYWVVMALSRNDAVVEITTAITTTTTTTTTTPQQTTGTAGATGNQPTTTGTTGNQPATTGTTPNPLDIHRQSAESALERMNQAFDLYFRENQ